MFSFSAMKGIMENAFLQFGANLAAKPFSLINCSRVVNLYVMVADIFIELKVY